MSAAGARTCGDQAGIDSRYATAVDATLVTAPTVAELLPRIESPRLDLRGAAQMIAGSGPLAGRTLFTGISRVQPGEQISVSGERLHREWGWQWEEYTPTTTDPSALLDALTEEVRATVTHRPTVSMLSGGWDSRLLLTLATRSSPRDLRALTTSSDTGTIMEELVAAQVAAELHVAHEVVMPRRDRFAADLATFARAVDFQTSFHVWLVPLVERLAELGPGRTVLDGLGGGLFVGGAFADPPGEANVVDKRTASTVRYLDGAEGILRPAVISWMRQAIIDDARPLIQRHRDHPHGHILSAYLTRTWPGISLAPHGLVQQEAQVATPFVATDVVRQGLELTPASHTGDRLYPLLMAQIHPRLANLATAQEQVPWPRPHPRRISSIEAIGHLRTLILTESLIPLLAPDLVSAGPRYWRKLISTTNGQHLLRGLAVFSLWLATYRDVIGEPDLSEWLR